LSTIIGLQPPKVKIHDVIEALHDKKVQDVIASNMTTTLSLMVDELITRKLDSILRSCAALMQENALLKSAVAKLETANAETAVRSSEGSADDILQPGSSSSVEQTVVAFCRDKLKIDIGPEDISAAHRLNKAGKDTTRPIIVRFTSLKVRD